MAYGSKIRETVFRRWLVVRNVEKVVAELRRDYPSLSVNTVSGWSKNFGWVKRGKAADAINARQDEAAPMGLIQELRVEVENVRKAILAGIKGSAELDDDGNLLPVRADGKTAQIVYAFKGMAEVSSRLIALEREEERRGASNTSADVIFAALSRHPKFKRLLDSAVVRKQLDALLEEEKLNEYRRAVA